MLEHDVFADADDALARAATSAGDQIVRWTDDWWLDQRWPKLSGSVMFHGSLSNADRVARELPWTPGAFCSTDRFACSAWWPGVAHALVSSRHLFTTVAELVADGAPSDFGSRVFVRPDSPLKPFSGRVVDVARLSLAALDHGYYYDNEALPVVVTPEVEIGEEWRFVVANSEVVAGCAYGADGRTAGEAVTSEHEAWSHAGEIVQGLRSPDPVFVLDICRTPGGLKLLELNPFSGADLYSCDRHAVVAAVHAVIAA